jgi:hypothetical protein
MRPYSAQWLRQFGQQNARDIAAARRALRGTGLGSRQASRTSAGRSSGS